LQCDAKEAELQRHSLQIAATASVASGARRTCTDDAVRIVHVLGNLVPAPRGADGAPQDNPRVE